MPVEIQPADGSDGACIAALHYVETSRDPLTALFFGNGSPSDIQERLGQNLTRKINAAAQETESRNWFLKAVDTDMGRENIIAWASWNRPEVLGAEESGEEEKEKPVPKPQPQGMDFAVRAAVMEETFAMRERVTGGKGYY